MVIYLVNIFSLLIYGYIYKKNNEKDKIKITIITLIVIQFSLIQGLRSYNIGTDTQKYVNYYNYMLNNHFSFFDVIINPPFNFEQGWIHLMNLCSFFRLPSRIFLIIVAFVINSLVGIFIYKESKNFIMSFWIFIGIEYFTLSFTMLRQMIAIGIIANSFLFLKSNDYRKSIILTCCAALFHKTALIFLVVIFITFLYKKYYNSLKKYITLNNKIKFIVLSETIILLFFKNIISFLCKIFYGYYKFNSGGLGTLWFVMMGVLILLLIYEKVNGIEKECIYYQLLLYIATLFQLCTVFIQQLSRGALYFYFFTIVALPLVTSKNNKTKYNRILKVSIYILTFFQYYFISMHIYNLVPYSIL